MKRLYKSNNRMLCGVCAGVAEYLGIDPTIVRLDLGSAGSDRQQASCCISSPRIVMPENLDVM